MNPQQPQRPEEWVGYYRDAYQQGPFLPPQPPPKPRDPYAFRDYVLFPLIFLALVAVGVLTLAHWI